jgi:ATP-dependent RNA helicase DDX60
MVGFSSGICFFALHDILAGDSLLQLVLDDPLLALGRTDGRWSYMAIGYIILILSAESSFQILHATYSLERLLDNFIKRGAVFEIVFWEGKEASYKVQITC